MRFNSGFKGFTDWWELCCSAGRVANGYGLDGLGIESWWGARFSAPVQTGPGAHPASCTMGTGSFPGVKSGRCVTLTPHPLPVPWSWKSRAIPLLPLWAYSLYRASVPVQECILPTFALLGHYAASLGNFLPTFLCPEPSVRSYHYSLRNASEERSS